MAVTRTIIEDDRRGPIYRIYMTRGDGWTDVLRLGTFEPYPTRAAFPTTGEADKVYLDLDTGDTHTWSGSAYTAADPGEGFWDLTGWTIAADVRTKAFTPTSTTTEPPAPLGELDAEVLNQTDPDTKGAVRVSIPSELSATLPTTKASETETDRKAGAYADVELTPPDDQKRTIATYELVVDADITIREA